MKQMNIIKRVTQISHLWHIGALMVVCVLFYYFYAFARLFGWESIENTLLKHHEFYGLVFFAPVVYSSYIYGARGSILTSLTSMLLLFPYSLSEITYPDAVLGPSSFAIILSAVGCSIAMLQKGEAQRLKGRNEMICLYDVGKAGDISNTTEDFVNSLLDLIPRSIQGADRVGLKIILRDKKFVSHEFQESPENIVEPLSSGDRTWGTITIYLRNGSFRLKRHYLFIKALSERVSGAIQRIEMDQSLKSYSEHLENMVKERTRDLEAAQEKIIRSEKLAAVGELASGVSHELRNPLNVIRNCVYLLNMTLSERSDETDEETRSTLKLLDQQVDISNKIVSDLLDFTRVRKPCLENLDLKNLIGHTVSLIDIPSGIKMEYEYQNQPGVVADSEQVQRAFLNIVSNSIQAMEGKGTLTIKTGTENGHAWVKFTDNGCGIPQENMEKIFEPLFTTKRKGIGLGLAITKRLIEQNNGMIEVASQVKQGTTFTVKLPCKKELVLA